MEMIITFPLAVFLMHHCIGHSRLKGFLFLLVYVPLQPFCDLQVCMGMPSLTSHDLISLHCLYLHYLKQNKK